MHTNAMKRLCKEPYKGEVIGFTEEVTVADPEDVRYYEIQDGTVIDLSDVDTTKGAIFFMGFDVLKRGCYFMDMVGSSDLSELSQIPIGIYYQGIPGGSFTFHGGGQEMVVQRKILFGSRYGVMRLRFMNGGLKLKELRFTFEKEAQLEGNWGSFEEYIYG